MPALGLWEITAPALTVLLGALLCEPTLKPFAVIVAVAAASVSPLTDGTVISGAPLETTRLTAEPAGAQLPAAGLSLTMKPAAILLLAALARVPTVRPAAFSAVVAALGDLPVTAGTVAKEGPLETVRAMLVPGETCAPAGGVCASTSPATVVLEVCKLTAPSANGRALKAACAAICVVPVTSGTATAAGPLETIRLTAEPGATEEPAAGDSLTTTPADTLEAWRFTAPSAN